MSKRIAVVDGANVAYSEISQKGDPKVANILAVRTVLEKKGYEPIVITDASLVYEIDDRPQLEALIADQDVRQVPAETDADYFIIETAREHDALIISNDQYESYRKDNPWIDQRRVPVMILHGNAELYEPKLEEYGE
ncbi:MAG TPA: hypothetical protein VGK56_08005 [Anaerolineales bacterium]